MRRFLILMASGLPLLVACSSDSSPQAPRGTTTGGTMTGGSSSGGSGPISEGLQTEVRTFCEDTCSASGQTGKPRVGDGKCEDGGPLSDFNVCAFGTDCTDCGSQDLEVPIVSGTGRAACGQDQFGVEEGDPAENWTSYDHTGAPVSLSDFCGKWVHIEFGRISCPTCAAHAPLLEDLAVQFKSYEEGLVVMDLLGENLNPIAPNFTEIPSQVELEVWVSEGGLNEVHSISDPKYFIHGRYWPFGEGTEFETAAATGHPHGWCMDPCGRVNFCGQLVSNSGGVKTERVELLMSDPKYRDCSTRP